MHGHKDLVLDEELMKPLDRFAGVSVLKVITITSNEFCYVF